jgi:RimJ/RimL family protein N-acetyltransferase
MTKPTSIIWRTGKKVVLRPHQEEDLSSYQSWINDPEINQYLMVIWPMSMTGQRKWFETASSSTTDDIQVAVCTKEGVLIGNMAMHINIRKRSAATGTLIGSKAHHNQGYATDAKMLLLDYAFNWLGLRKVTSSILSLNGASKSYATKCGYRHMATIEQEHFREGKWIDEEQYVVFRDDWLPLWEQYKQDL